MSEGKDMIAKELSGEFSKAVEPVVIDNATELCMFRCTGCENVHFRHAGYLEMLMPFMRSDGEKKVSKDSYQVHVCTKCRKCYIWLNERFRDVTKLIDLKAWEKAEQDLHRATGPGGEC